MRQAIYSYLTADVTLMGILSGGLYDANEVGEISRQNTPEAFDANSELKPCGLMRMGSPTSFGPYTYSARSGMSLLFYERAGYANTEAARERVYTLLHESKLTPAGETAGCWVIRWTDDVLQQEDTALKASLELSRYEAVVMRRE